MTRLLACLALSLICTLDVVLARQAQPDTCLMFMATNLAKGNGNFFIYYQFSSQRVKIEKGDTLEYDLYLDKSNPVEKGGVDFEHDGPGRNSLRDSGSVDQNNQRAHGDSLLKDAVGKWKHRSINLDRLAGRTVTEWTLNFEGDPSGRYVQFVDNVVVKRADGSTVSIYTDGPPPAPKSQGRDGYSQVALCTPVERSQVTDGADLSSLIEQQAKRQVLLQQIADARKNLDLVRRIAETEKDAHMLEHAQEAADVLAQINQQQLDPQAVEAALHRVTTTLDHHHTQMQKYTGYLVGHAHIDFQWLWEWPECITVCRDTFGQAVKFMEEFPQFTFTQSSSALYRATEEAYPELFKKMQKYVADGRWEIVGGRVCEGDEFMISPESHARQFLYGQSYFRERFNRTATVGWEPDTFGHVWTMPQILKLGGCKYYYFCRGGFGKPLFWWEGPDGTRILTFDEPASGGWYNGDVTSREFDDLLKFLGVTGFRDMIWVYGVGNHGGGPTRENIEQALAWQTNPSLPRVKFATATEFFNRLEQNDLSKLPVIRTEMDEANSHAYFDGCWTSHSDIKRWNRDAEAITTSAETVAALASRYGFEYPHAEFRRNWEDICWNHHHDTLPGTSIHPSYFKSEQMYARVIESSRSIAQQALASLSAKVSGQGTGVVVFNPLGWSRGGIVEFPLEGNVAPTARPLVAVAPDGTKTPLQPIPGVHDRALGWVTDIPSCGYRRFRVTVDEAKSTSPVSVSDDGTVLENGQFKVTIDPSRGVISSIIDKQSGKEAIAKDGSGNRLEIHWEKGGDAWKIGPVEKIEPLVDAVKLKVVEKGPVRVVVEWTRKFQKTDLVQSVTLNAQGAPEFALRTTWNELGEARKLNPTLKVAFDVNVANPKQTYDIPFGQIVRPADGREQPARQWVDSADDSFGCALINDSKHGYSAKDNTLRMSLIRSSSGPDGHPNSRAQFARWAFVPHAGNWQQARVNHLADEFNRPLLGAFCESNPDGTLPAEQSLLSFGSPDVVLTGIKLGERSNDLVVRFFESAGRPAAAVLASPLNLSNISSVNFLEDKLADEPDTAIELRPYEIRTLKMAVKK